MTGPKDLADAARKRYPDYLASLARGEGMFPLELGFKPPKPGEAARRWNELRSELESLRSASDEARPGASYRLQWETRNDRLAGRQMLPEGAYFPDESSYLTFLGKKAEAERFKHDLATIVEALPALLPWTVRKPERIVRHAGEWPGILASVRWFRDHPDSGLYLRQVPAVEDTKFIERHKAIIDELLDELAGADAAETVSVEARPARFELRHGLRIPEPLVRVRVLDQALADRYLSGLSDLAVPATELDRLAVPELSSVIFVENKTSFAGIETLCCLPSRSGALAIFGSGYAAVIAAHPEFARLRILYWGDIDSHGLRILAGVRTALPATRSIMMDHATFERFPEYRCDAPRDAAAVPEGLTPEELELYLRLAPLSSGNRLEQERIPFNFVRAAFEAAYLP